MQKSSKNSLLKKFTLYFNLIVINTENLSNPFHGQTSLKDTIFSALKSRAKLLLIVLRIGLRLGVTPSQYNKVVKLLVYMLHQLPL